MKRSLTTLTTLLIAIGLALPAGAASSQFPDLIQLPNGIAPEGIVSGNGTDFYVGSLADGTVYKGDLRTGSGDFINDASDFGGERVAVGLDYDRRTNAVWVAGGGTGAGYVYDGDSGETIATIPLASSTPTFVNDVVVTNDTAFFTESAQPVMYAVQLDNRGLPTGEVDTVTMGGDFEFFPGEFNANGIVATPNGHTLIIVNSFIGALYTVDPATGDASAIDLGGADVVNGDGMLLDGKTIYVVQNFLNQIGVVKLASDLTSGTVVDPIADSDFMIPTTVAEFGNSLYAVNARFDTEPGPDVEYQVVNLAKD